jgi:hypothetical protein
MNPAVAVSAVEINGMTSASHQPVRCGAVRDSDEACDGHHRRGREAPIATSVSGG